MGNNKTIANDGDVNEFISSLADAEQAKDAEQLVAWMSDITGERPMMWGNAIIGFGAVQLTYASGRVVDWLKIGFSPRAGKISLYVTFDAAELTSKFPNLGKYKIAKGCIYLRRLSDVNGNELRELIKHAYDVGYEQPKRTDGKEQIKKLVDKSGS